MPEAALVLVVPFTTQRLLSHEWPLMGLSAEEEPEEGYETLNGKFKILFVDQA